MASEHALFMVDKCKAVLHRLIKSLDAGLSASVAYELAFKELDQEYRKFCALEHVQPVNHFLSVPDVEMFARFGLDALFGAQPGKCSESFARAAFWQTFRRATRGAQLYPAVEVPTSEST